MKAYGGSEGINPRIVNVSEKYNMSVQLYVRVYLLSDKDLPIVNKLQVVVGEMNMSRDGNRSPVPRPTNFFAYSLYRLSHRGFIIHTVYQILLKWLI